MLVVNPPVPGPGCGCALRLSSPSNLELFLKIKENNRRVYSPTAAHFLSLRSAARSSGAKKQGPCSIPSLRLCCFWRLVQSLSSKVFVLSTLLNDVCESVCFEHGHLLIIPCSSHTVPGSGLHDKFFQVRGNSSSSLWGTNVGHLQRLVCSLVSFSCSASPLRYEVYMRWSLTELHNWGNVTKATLRLYTLSSTGPAHMYLQHLDHTTWGDNGGSDLKWHTRCLL